MDHLNRTAAGNGKSAAIALFLALAATAVAVAAPHDDRYSALNSLPDWSGTWTYNYLAPSANSPPEPRGKYLEAYRSWQAEMKKTQGNAPQAGSHCLPPGMPMIMMIPQYPIEFLFTPGRVTTHHEAWMQWRNIYTDGRGHSADMDPTFNGDSIGHWEGGTLVVETVGTKPAANIGVGLQHSDKLKILERIHLAKDDPDTLVDELTAQDPEALEKPWSTVLTFRRQHDEPLLEFVCDENDRNPVNSSGETGFK